MTLQKYVGGMLPLYLSKEATTDDVLKKMAPHAIKFDVVARKEIGGEIVARWPWHYSLTKPKLSQRTVMFNCFRYEAIWITSVGTRVHRDRHRTPTKRLTR